MEGGRAAEATARTAWEVLGREGVHSRIRREKMEPGWWVARGEDEDERMLFSWMLR